MSPFCTAVMFHLSESTSKVGQAFGMPVRFLQALLKSSATCRGSSYFPCPQPVEAHTEYMFGVADHHPVFRVCPSGRSCLESQYLGSTRSPFLLNNSPPSLFPCATQDQFCVCRIFCKSSSCCPHKQHDISTTAAPETCVNESSHHGFLRMAPAGLIAVPYELQPCITIIGNKQYCCCPQNLHF